MKVWILETDVYEQRGVVGVFATAQAAMASHRPDLEQEWTFDERFGWSNNLDMGAAADVTEWDVQGADS